MKFICSGKESRGGSGLKVICAWCGDVIRRFARKPSKGMCQSCFARMMAEHSRAFQALRVCKDASDR